MIIIGNTLVSEELLSESFHCELSHCKGACCIEGDAGAPLEAEEVELICTDIEEIRPFMSEHGIHTLENEGFHCKDVSNSLVTTLIDEKECVFTIFEHGCAACAIERAFHAGRTSFQKPISCHLYPVRITSFPDYEGVNVHRWSVCAQAWKAGKRDNVALYRYLRQPLIRKYGCAWYEELEHTVEVWNASRD